MTESIKSQPPIEHSQERTTPQIFDKTSEEGWQIDPHQTASAMSEHYGISEKGVENTSIVIDDKNRRSYKGSQTPKWLDRVMRGRQPENEGSGSVVRISTQIRGQERTAEDVNHTLSHELEHVAQSDRKDRKLILGNIAVWGLAAAGALAGNKLGRSRYTKTIGAITGAAIG